jgi:hypothetical protein
MSEEEVRIDPVTGDPEPTDPPPALTHRLCVATRRREGTDICQYVEVRQGSSVEFLESVKEDMLTATNGLEAAICEIGQEPVWSWTVTDENPENAPTETPSDGD